MKLHHKTLLLALAALCLACTAIALVVRHQAMELKNQQRATIEAAYLASKNAELKHYADLAVHALAPLYNTGRSDVAIKNEARQILAGLDFGNDGYFFVYDQSGRNLMHPRQPELVGANMWNWRDASGSLTVQHLIERANQGGGYERYLWQKPSSKTVAPKLGYVVGLPRWGWVIGTAIYLDDIEATLAQVDVQIVSRLRQTMLLIAAVALLSALCMGLAGALLNGGEQRAGDAKLRRLAQRVVSAQEEQRAHLSRDLHDGIGQWLLSIRLQIEAALIRLHGAPEQVQAAHGAFEKSAGQINGVLAEARRLSHALRPAVLDDLGLAAALDQLCGEWRMTAGAAVTIHFKTEGHIGTLPDFANIILFRVAQAVLGDIARRAKASEIVMRLHGDDFSVKLQVRDNGGGALGEAAGRNLRDLQEQMEAMGGELALDGFTPGQRVSAAIHRRFLVPLDV